MEVEVFKRFGDTVLDIIETQDSPVVAARRAALYNVVDEFSSADDSSDGSASLPSDGGTHHQMSVEAIASYSALLGNGDDYEKTVREILFIREHGEPEPDPIDATNAWTSAYVELEAAVNNDPAPMALADELVGTEKTRSMLGLPLNNGVSVLSDDITGIQTYELSSNVVDVIDSLRSEIDEKRNDFLNRLKRPDGKDIPIGLRKPDEGNVTESNG